MTLVSFTTQLTRVVVDTLSRLSMGSTTNVEDENNELAKDMHRLARLGVILMDSIGRGIVVNIGLNYHKC